MGRSGSGKTTLLNVLAGLETPSGGEVLVAGRDLSRMDRRQREAHRRGTVGYVWQQPEDGLLRSLSVAENMLVPPLGARRPGPDQPGHAMRLLDAMRLGRRLDDRPAALSPAETQRLAPAGAPPHRPPA